MPKPPWPLDHCKGAISSKWGKQARHYLGDVLYETALNAELLLLLSTQDDEVNPATLVRILTDGRRQIIDEMIKED